MENKRVIAACILDSFSEKCYENTVNIIKISPTNYINELKENNVQILFVESAWNGNDGLWSGKIFNVKKSNTQILEDLIDYCKKNNIPTIFWNKEDPVHYNKFIKIANLFDYVFTTDVDCIYKYKKDLNNTNVYLLPFAANPSIHNPIKLLENRINKSCFAGSYYNFQYKDRRNDTKKLLRIAIKYGGLDIYDRNFKLSNPLYEFPNEFKPYIKGYLDVKELSSANKGYKIVLNVNSVKYSPTMFSRRVFESLASGTPVISTYSLGINKIFKGLVVSSDNEQDLEQEFKNLQDQDYYYNKMVDGVRLVLKYHTYENRMKFILKKIGIKIDDLISKLVIVCKIDTEYEYKLAIDTFIKQSYKHKELYIFSTNKNILSENNNHQNIKTIVLDYKTQEARLEEIIRCDFVGIIDTNNIYKKFYFEDLMLASLYTNATFIGKKTYYEYDNEMKMKIVNLDMDYKYVNALDLDKCIVIYDKIKHYKIKEFMNYINNNEISKNLSKDIYFSIDRNNLISSKSLKIEE